MNSNITSDRYQPAKPIRMIGDKAMDIGRNVTHHPIIKEVFNSTIMKKISISVYFTHWMCQEYNGLRYIVKHSKDFKHSGKGNVVFNTFYNKDYVTKLMLDIPNIETYIIMDDNRTICHLEPTKTDSLDHDGDSKLLKVTFIGKNAYKYMHGFTMVLKKAHIERTHGEQGETKSICINILKEDSILSTTYDLCSFDDIVMKNKESLIIKPLESFFKAKDLYTKYKVTYKLGILLYGVPGTGKTTLTRAIINAALEKFHVCCYLVTLNSKSESLEAQLTSIYNCAVNNNVSILIKYKTAINIIILEEIDSVFPKNRENCSDEQLEKINMLLQFLDGPRTPDNTIFIATTNHKDKLDEAMIRDGRFNIHVNMNNFDKDEAIEMCNKYNVSIDNIIDMKDEDTIKPATLQKLIFNHIMDTKVLHIEKKN